MSAIRMQLWVVILLATLAGADATAGDLPRIAVLEVGPADQVPAALLDLFMSHLAQQDDLVLLERAEVDRLLREQELALFANAQHYDFPATTAVSAGNLMAVDAFVLLEAHEQALRMRIVETRHGMRLDDTRLSRPLPNEMESTAAQLTARVRWHMSRVFMDPAQLQLVSVLAFRSVEPSPQWDHLGDELRAGLEQLLMLESGIIVAERQRTRALSDERELVRDLPPALRASVLVVDGEYRIDEEYPDLLIVDVRGRRDGTNVFVDRIAGSRDKVYTINRALADMIGERLGDAPTTVAMDARLEADMLLAQARVAPHFAAAIGAIEAAIALMPDEYAYRLAYLSRVYDECIRGPDALRAQRLRRYTAMAGPLVGEWLRQSPDVTPPAHIETVLRNLPYMLRRIEGGDRTREEVRELLEGQVRPLIENSWAALRSYDGQPLPQRGVLVDCVLSVYYQIGAASVHEARAVLDFALDHGPAVLELSTQSIWPTDLNTDKRFDLDHRLYESMLDHERPEVRLAAKRGMVRLYATGGQTDYALARRHYEEFERFFLQSFLKLTDSHQRPLYQGEWVLPILNNRGHERPNGYRFHEDAAQDIHYRAERLIRVVERVAEYPLHILHAHWLFSAEDIRIIEQAGRPDEADRILALYVDKMKRVVADHPRAREVGILRAHITRLERARNRLHGLHPALRTPAETPEVTAWQATRMFALDEAVALLSAAATNSARSFSALRLVMEHGMAAVMMAQGVLFMDPQSLTPTRYEEAPEGISLGAGYAADDSGLYTVSKNGIVFFPKGNGRPHVFFENHPDLAEKIHDVDVLNGSVYVLVGEASGYAMGETLLQFVLNTTHRRIVLSAKAELGDSPLGNLRGMSHIATDPVNSWLRICASSSDEIAYLAYHPEIRAFTRLPGLGKSVVTAGLKSRRRGKELITWGIHEVAFYDMEHQERLAVVVSRQSRFDAYSAFVRIGRDIIGNHDFMRQLNYFSAGSAEPQDVLSNIFPPSGNRLPAIRDMWMHEQGLLILGTRDLYAVTGIKAREAFRESGTP